MELRRSLNLSDERAAASLVAVPHPPPCINVPTALFRVVNDFGLNVVDDPAAGLSTQPSLSLSGAATDLVLHTYASPRPSQPSS